MARRRSEYLHVFEGTRLCLAWVLMARTALAKQRRTILRQQLGTVRFTGPPAAAIPRGLRAPAASRCGTLTVLMSGASRRKLPRCAFFLGAGAWRGRVGVTAGAIRPQGFQP